MSAAFATTLALVAPFSPVSMPSWSPDVRAAAAFAQTRRGKVSFAVRSQTSHGRIHAWGFRQDVLFDSASVIKAMLLVAYLQQPAVRSRDLHGDERALMAAMVRWSSNDAATEVLARVGQARLSQAAQGWGMRRFRVRRPWGSSEITAGEQARFFLHIDQRLPARHRQYGLRLLRQIVAPQRWGIATVVPAGWVLHLKGGWGSGTGKVDHQVALLTRGSQRVSLAILSADQGDHDYGKATLRGVASRLLRGLQAVDARV